MAIAVLQGHTQRAIDFYNKKGKFFVIGGTEPWIDEASPDKPSLENYRLKDIVGYKRVDTCELVIPVTESEIEKYGYTNLKEYRTQKWRVVLPPFRTTVKSPGVPKDSQEIPVSSLASISVGSKIRINNAYEGIVTKIDTIENVVTIDTPAPVSINSGSPVEGGALVEGAHYVYVDCYLEYNKFPLVTYRQIGLCTEVTPDASVLRAAGYDTETDEFSSVGVLEVLDNRAPSTRDIDQRELLSLILEY